MPRIPGVLFLILTTACMDDQPYYQYADGSANVYVLTADSLEYVPVTPEQSSTGFYSGGDPKKIAITPQQFRTVRAMLETAKSKHEIHLPDRIKTSGVITTVSKSQKSSIVLKPGSPELVRIERALKELLK